MKIGILTFHLAHNYGAVLQCYALQEVRHHDGKEAEAAEPEASQVIGLPLISIKESRIPSPIQISIIASVLRPNVPNHPILSVCPLQN